MSERGRFAPSPTGPAHPGTLLSGLLAWLDARSRGAEFELRIENTDTERCKETWIEEMRAALVWLGLDWDYEHRQNVDHTPHVAALEALWKAGRTYVCGCSRAQIREAGEPAADGGFRYPGTCREKNLEAQDGTAIRFALEPGYVEVADEGGVRLGQDPWAEMGDPIVRRRNGDLAYHLSVVVDDARRGITRVVRGRDVAASTAIHVALQRELAYATPNYHHHFLLREERGRKLAKLHGSVSWSDVAAAYTPEAFCGWLAHVSGIATDTTPIRATELVEGFSWSDVRAEDATVRWTGERLEQVPKTELAS